MSFSKSTRKKENSRTSASTMCSIPKPTFMECSACCCFSCHSNVGEDDEGVRLHVRARTASADSMEKSARGEKSSPMAVFTNHSPLTTRQKIKAKFFKQRSASASTVDDAISATSLLDAETSSPFPPLKNLYGAADRPTRSEQKLFGVGNLLKSRKENLPPNIAQLLQASECEYFAEQQNGFEEKFQSGPNSQPLLSAAVAIDASNDDGIRGKSSPKELPLFRPSRFSNVPPTLRFVSQGEKVEKPKRNVRRQLKWCYNNLVPKVVRKILYASHFQIVSEDSYWVGYWGRHLRTQAFRKILPFQKVNHFPGTFHLGRKDRLWINIRRMMLKWNIDEDANAFNIMPPTFVLPKDAKRLKAFMKENGQLTPIILKPPASARGNGIRLVHRWGQIPRREPTIAQIYIDRPFLIAGSKFDLRLYVYVTCFNPLRIYLYEDGLVRFASVKYSNNLSALSNRLMHLTNYSVNKNASAEERDRSTTGQKWSLKELWRYLSENGHDVSRLMERIVNLILKAFISCESPVNTIIRKHLPYPFACHELFGVDIVLDESLTPWLLEVNISPSLHTSTDLDMAIKSELAKDTLNLAGVQMPDRNQIHSLGPRLPLELFEPSGPNCMDLRIKQNDNTLSEEEKIKQALFLKKFSNTNTTDPSILDYLTGSDVRVLIETEDEYDRRGQFARIFPSPCSTRYLKYLEKPKYYNLLLEEWVCQYWHVRETGLAHLEALCKSNFHLLRKSAMD